MRTFGSRPNPNQITNSGAMATIGIVWLVTRNGSTARRTGPQRSSAIAGPDRERHRQRAAHDRLDQRRDEWPTAASRKSHRAPSTRDGDGSVIGSMPARRT